MEDRPGSNTEKPRHIWALATLAFVLSSALAVLMWSGSPHITVRQLAVSGPVTAGPVGGPTSLVYTGSVVVAELRLGEPVRPFKLERQTPLNATGTFVLPTGQVQLAQPRTVVGNQSTGRCLMLRWPGWRHINATHSYKPGADASVILLDNTTVSCTGFARPALPLAACSGVFGPLVLGSKKLQKVWGIAENESAVATDIILTLRSPWRVHFNVSFSAFGSNAVLLDSASLTAPRLSGLSQSYVVTLSPPRAINTLQTTTIRITNCAPRPCWNQNVDVRFATTDCPITASTTTTPATTTTTSSTLTTSTTTTTTTTQQPTCAISHFAPYAAVTTSLTRYPGFLNQTVIDATGLRLVALVEPDGSTLNETRHYLLASLDILNTTWTHNPVYTFGNLENSVLTVATNMSGADIRVATAEEVVQHNRLDYIFGIADPPTQQVEPRYFLCGRDKSAVRTLAVAFNLVWPGTYGVLLPIFERHHTHSLVHKNPETTYPYQNFVVYKIPGYNIAEASGDTGAVAQAAVVAFVTATATVFVEDFYVANYTTGACVLNMTRNVTRITNNTVLVLPPAINWRALRWILHTNATSASIVSNNLVTDSGVFLASIQASADRLRPVLDFTLSIDIVSTGTACQATSYDWHTAVLERASSGDPTPCNNAADCYDLR